MTVYKQIVANKFSKLLGYFYDLRVFLLALRGHKKFLWVLKIAKYFSIRHKGEGKDTISLT